MVIVCAMYGLKSSGAAWHAQLSIMLRDMNFEPAKSDPDVWFRAASKPDVFQYYKYILVYVDDILAISHQPYRIMNTIKIAYRLKDEPLPPTTYLGSSTKEWSISRETRKV